MQKQNKAILLSYFSGFDTLSFVIICATVQTNLRQILILNIIKRHFSYINSHCHASKCDIVKPLKLQNMQGEAMQMMVFFSF